MSDKTLREFGSLLRQLYVPVSLMHFLHFMQQLHREGSGLVIDNSVMNAAQQKQILEPMPLFVCLATVISRASRAAAFDVAHVTCDRPTGLNNRGVAFRKCAAVSRQRKQPFDRAFGWRVHNTVILRDEPKLNHWIESP